MSQIVMPSSMRCDVCRGRCGYDINFALVCKAGVVTCQYCLQGEAESFFEYIFYIDDCRYPIFDEDGSVIDSEEESEDPIMSDVPIAEGQDRTDDPCVYLYLGRYNGSDSSWRQNTLQEQGERSWTTREGLRGYVCPAIRVEHKDCGCDRSAPHAIFTTQDINAGCGWNRIVEDLWEKGWLASEPLVKVFLVGKYLELV